MPLRSSISRALQLGWEAGIVKSRAFIRRASLWAGRRCHHPSMLLAVDVGNTQTHVGAFEGADLVADWRLAPRGDSTADEIALALAGSLEFRGLSMSMVDRAIV